jgi:hypothetical protein
MKKISMFLGFALIISIFLMSCTKEEMSSNKLNANPYDYIGELHNQGMNEFRIRLQDSIAVNSTMDVSTFVTEYMENKISNNKDVVLKDKSQLNKNLYSLIYKVKVTKPFYVLKSNKSDSTNVQNSIENSNLSDFQKEYVNELLSILEKQDSVKERIIKLESVILNSDKTVKEKEPILCIISITKYSYEFWNENISSKKIRMQKAPNASYVKTFSAGGAVRADAEGAIGGVIWSVATGASTTGLVFGPGGYVLTTAGSAVTGGLYGSALYLGLFGWF